MNSIVIDTNPLAYIYRGVPGFGEKFANLLGNLGRENTLLIPKLVYGELSIIFEDINELNAFLTDTGILIGDVATDAYVIAAKRWQAYNRHRVLTCHACGERIDNLKCNRCGSAIKIRQHILSDFIIGAYALQMKGSTLVTNDRGYFSTYFPELKIIS